MLFAKVSVLANRVERLMLIALVMNLGKSVDRDQTLRSVGSILFVRAKQ